MKKNHCICVIITSNNTNNITKLVNETTELDDFDVFIFDQSEKYSNICPVAYFGSSSIPDKFVTNFIRPKNGWDYFPIWANTRAYKYYWIVEDLVYYSGNWADLFKKYCNVKCDLLTTTNTLQNSTWCWWTRSRNLYSSTEMGYPQDITKYSTAFHPFTRFSRNLVEYGYKLSI